MIKQLIFFKKYLVPHPKKNPEIFALLSRFYSTLALDKMAGYATPYLLKTALNLVVSASISPSSLATLFGAYWSSQILKTFFEGKRITINSQITRLAYMDMAMRIYSSLLNLDL